MEDLDWGGEDVAALRERWRSRAGFEITIPRLLEWWAELAGAVENGYDQGPDEYTNDLDSRALLEEAVQELTPPHASRLRELLEPIDEKFRSVTSPLDRPVSAGGWWAYRMPLSVDEDTAAVLLAWSDPAG